MNVPLGASVEPDTSMVMSLFPRGVSSVASPLSEEPVSGSGRCGAGEKNENLQGGQDGL